MILETGKNDIESMYDGYRKLKKLLIQRNVIMNGPIYITDTYIYINKLEIRCTTESGADKLFDLIHETILGTRQEKLERILNTEE